MKKRLAIVTTHPIQYNAPLFKLLAERNVIDLKVFYTWGNVSSKMFDKKFGLKREWDIPLTEGYDFEMVHNFSLRPDSNQFFGIVNWRLHNVVQHWKPDAVLVFRWSVWSHFIFMSFFRIKNCRLLFRGDSVLNHTSSSIQSRFLDGVKKFVFRKVDCALFVGKRNRLYYENLGFEKSRLFYAPHCIDNHHFQNNADEWEKKAALRRSELGIRKDDIVFLFAGKFYEAKDLTTLIKVFKKIKEPFCKLILAGSGKQEEELKRLAASDQRILFLGFSNQSEMPLVYRLGNVFVLPSISETWGLSVNEAMVCGLPALISRDCGCCSELIIEGETGFTFKGEADLQYKMRLFHDLDMIKKMKVEVKKHIAHFNMESLALNLENLTCS
jgi:glycosyltransferase involved in cell wall biosynthesis